MTDQKKCYEDNKCETVDLICDACKRYFCSKHWLEADDENFNWKLEDDGLHHMPSCDLCNYDCKCGECDECKKEKEYFK
jgi:hypothetical protein